LVSSNAVLCQKKNRTQQSQYTIKEAGEKAVGLGGYRSAGKKEKERRKNTHLLPQQKLMIPTLLLLLLLDLLGAAPLFLFQTLDASLLHLQLRVIGGFFLDQALQGGGCD
jgi:hypothetical protein